MNTCASCVWFDRFTADERSIYYPNEGDGWCRRFPPVGDLGQPLTHDDGRCGEHNHGD